LHLTATVSTQKLPTLTRPVARHGRHSVKGKRKQLAASTKAKHVKLVVRHLKAHTVYVVKVTGTGIGGTAADSARGRTRRARK
jgi:hypothetical protein